MKKISIYLVVIVLSSSCRSLKPVIASGGSVQPTKASTPPPQFLDDISISTPSQHGAASSKETVITAPPEEKQKDVVIEPIVKTTINEKAAIENSSKLQFKYSILIDVPVEKLSNVRLLEFIEEWYGTRYKFGGSGKKGIDCSAFSGTLIATVFGGNLPRMARDQFFVTERIGRSRLKEGDLVFFNTRGGISHVGVYLANNKFIHASSSHGVVISDLGEGYYARTFIAAGRVSAKGVSATNGH